MTALNSEHTISYVYNEWFSHTHCHTLCMNGHCLSAIATFAFIESPARGKYVCRWTTNAIRRTRSVPRLTREGVDLLLDIVVVGDKDGVHEHVLVDGSAGLPCSVEGVVVSCVEERCVLVGREHRCHGCKSCLRWRRWWWWW